MKTLLSVLAFAFLFGTGNAQGQEKKFSVKTPDVEIHVSPEYLNRLEARVIDGKKCLVIEVDDNVEVNGVPVKTIANRMGGEF